MCRASEIAARKLADQAVKVVEAKIKFHLLADDAGKGGYLQKQFSVKETQLTFARLALEASEATFEDGGSGVWQVEVRNGFGLRYCRSNREAHTR